MQTLGLSDSTPRTESRLKSLFWPTIRTQWDLDYVTNQGFWICVLVGGVTFGFGLFTGGGIVGILDFIFYLLAGSGVRLRSRVAAVTALALYTLSGVVLQMGANQGFGVMRILFMATLLANVRGIWISASWPKPVPEDTPEQTALTFFDKVSDRLPALLWPRLKWLFYILAALEILGLAAMLFPIGSGTGLPA
jgi:hypothetical protein